MENHFSKKKMNKKTRYPYKSNKTKKEKKGKSIRLGENSHRMLFLAFVWNEQVKHKN